VLRVIDRICGLLGVRIALVLMFVGILAAGALTLVRSALA
jgi:hypothetical protein